MKKENHQQDQQAKEEPRKVHSIRKSIVPIMKDVKCFNCKKLGHVAEDFRNKEVNSSQQKKQQSEKHPQLIMQGRLPPS